MGWTGLNNAEIFAFISYYEISHTFPPHSDCFFVSGRHYFQA